MKARNAFDLTEADRRHGNVISMGVIVQVNCASARAKVKIEDEAITDWLPWTALRAGKLRIWSPLSVGEQVVVLSPGGDPARGVIIPSIYQDSMPQPSREAKQDTLVWDDGARITYDSEKHELIADLPGKAKIKAASEISAKAPSVSVEAGDVSIEAGQVQIRSSRVNITGDLTVTGRITDVLGNTNHHRH